MLRSIIRVSSISFIIGGLLLGLYQIFHPDRDAHSVLQHPYALIHNIGMFALVLITFGIIGLYLFLYAKAPVKRFIMVLFFLTLLGSVFEVGALFLDAYFNPFAATYVPSIQTSGHNHNFFNQNYPIYGVSIFMLPLTWLIFILGHIGTAVVLIKSKMFGWFSSLLIIVGTPLFGMQLFVPVFVETVGAILLGLGYLLVGISLYQKKVLVQESEK